MDLTQLANLGEFIGGVAVLVTLIYLAVQLRHPREDPGLRISLRAHLCELGGLHERPILSQLDGT